MIFISRLWLIGFVTLFLNQQGLASNLGGQSIIKNGAFSELDKNGNPIGWICSCQSQQINCDIKNNPTSGSRILTLKPGCQLSSVNFPISNQKEGISLNLITALVPDYFQDISLIAYSNSDWNGHVPFEISHPSFSSKQPDGFVIKAAPLSSDKVNTISVRIYNNHGNDIQIQEVDVLQNGENPPTKSAALLEITHETVLKILPNSNVKDIWLPLPSNYASQVPLWISLNPTPVSAIHSIHYSEDSEGNWGAIVELNNYVLPGTEIHFRWDGIVLTRMIDEGERSSVYQAESDPSAWLQSTKSVESQYQPIVDKAIELTKNDADLLKKISDISFWEAKNLQPPRDGDSNDSIATFKNLRANCVGFSNLGSAMGRAIAIPTRSVANVIVDGISQDTHFIDEFYLGPNSGWRRIEPQSGSSTSVPEDTYLIIHKNVPKNEGEKAFDQGIWGAAGTPYLSGVVNLNDSTANVTFLPAENTFPDCPTCDNRAEHWVDLRGSHNEMKQLFDIARKNWEYDLHDYLKNGDISLKRKIIRNKVPSIQSTSDLKELLTELDRSD